MIKMRKVRNSKGFTLIELMATVAIIGVLAAIAIPNYMKYQRKARQAEAKVLLGSAFLSEKAINQDQHSYTACLVQAGFGADGTTPNNFYAVGFGSNGVTASTANCGPYNGTTGVTTGGTDDKCGFYSWKNVSGKYTGVASCTVGTAGNSFIAGAQYLNTQVNTAAQLDTAANKTSVSYNTFIVGAAGSISDSNSTLDMWQIDYNKTLYQTQDGTQ